ncbi:MAG: SMP-30/gluconolactonase/LRE family protein [Verrucomicrobia bacterium]|nr:SMP-30/gluconolactonase/LRE family protein [Verrucomicrobiota bacterium]
MKMTLLSACLVTASSACALDFNAPVEKLGGDFQFTEGPVWVAAKSALLFSDIPANRIVRFQDGKFTTFREPSRNSNGLTLDKQGRLIACEHGSRRVTRTEADGTITVLAARYEGKRLNSPNDVVVRSDGAIYFTDPPYGVKQEERELDFQGVYRLSPDGKALTLLVKDFVKPNGLAFSPDEKILYVNDTEGGHLRAFDVAPDGTLSNSRIFAKTPSADGMKVDSAGNVYCTSATGVMGFDATGKHLGTFTMAEQPANCAFGDADWKSLYMTCRTGLYRVRLAVPGSRVP